MCLFPLIQQKLTLCFQKYSLRRIFKGNMEHYTGYKIRSNLLSAVFKSTQANKTNGSVKMYLQIQLKLYHETKHQ